MSPTSTRRFTIHKMVLMFKIYAIKINIIITATPLSMDHAFVLRSHSIILNVKNEIIAISIISITEIEGMYIFDIKSSKNDVTIETITALRKQDAL